MSKELAGEYVAYWSFTAPPLKKLPDRTGRFDGAAHGVVASDTGVAWYFAGGKEHVRVPHDPALDLVDGFTLEAIVRLDKIGNPRNDLGVQAILEKHIDKGGWLFVVDGEGRLHCWMENQNGLYMDTSTVALEARKWYHVALTWDKKKSVFYVNGEHAGEKDFAGPLDPCTQDLYIGNDDTKDWSWRGDIELITIRNRALSAEEIAKLAEK